MPHVARDDGLVVGWMTSTERGQLWVEVWQVYIDGKKPSDLGLSARGAKGSIGYEAP